MPYVKPGPGQAWCPCCEQLYPSTAGGSRLCERSVCLARRDAWRKGVAARQAQDKAAKEAYEATVKRCARCSAVLPAHTPQCRIGRLGKPCFICGRPFDPNIKHPDPDAPTREHQVPKLYRKTQGMGQSDEHHNVSLAHSRCNAWKGVRLPRDIHGFQPPWGVKPGVAKVTQRDLPPATTKPVTHPLRGQSGSANRRTGSA